MDAGIEAAFVVVLLILLFYTGVASRTVVDLITLHPTAVFIWLVGGDGLNLWRGMAPARARRRRMRW